MSGVSWKDLRKTAEDATKPLADDWYECVVDSAEATTASTGSPMIKAVLQVTDGTHAGRKLWTQFTFTADNPNALIFFFRNMAALGLGESFFDGLTAQGLDVDQSMRAIAQSIEKRKVRVKTEIRKWNGADRNNVAELQPSTTGPGGLPGGQPAVGLPNLGGAGLPGGVGSGLPGGGGNVAGPNMPTGLGSTSSTPAVSVPHVPVTSTTESTPDSQQSGSDGPPLPF